MNTRSIAGTDPVACEEDAIAAVRLVAAGLFHFSEDGPRHAPRLAPPSTISTIDCGPTELGYVVREAWWTRWRAKAEDAE